MNTKLTMTTTQRVAFQHLNTASTQLGTARQRLDQALQYLLDIWPQFPKAPFYELGLPRETIRRLTPNTTPQDRDESIADTDVANKALKKAEQATKTYLSARERADAVTNNEAEVFMGPLRGMTAAVDQRGQQCDTAQEEADKALDRLHAAWPDFNRAKFVNESGIQRRTLFHLLKKKQNTTNSDLDPEQAWADAVQAYQDYREARHAWDQAKADRYTWVKTTRVATVDLVSVRQIAEAAGVQYQGLRKRLADDGFDDNAEVQAMAWDLLSEQETEDDPGAEAGVGSL